VERAPSAVVLGVGGAAGVSAIRLLGRRGINVFAVDHQLSPLGFRSRYAIPRRIPDPERDEHGFAAALRALGDELGGGVPILPARDEDLNALARARPELGGRFLYPFPSWEILGPIQEKRFQVQRATELGLATPSTVDDPADVERFPVLVKPSRPAGFRARFRRQALVCATRRELERAFEAARAFDPLVQELIPGPDRLLFTLGAYIDEAGSPPLAVFCGRKLRQSPSAIGTCRVGEARWNDTVVEQGVRLLRELSFTGIAQVEFKYDRRDGKFKFIEINPRLWQWHENAAVCGVDFPWIAYQDLTAGEKSAITSRGSGKRWGLTFYTNLAPAFVRPPYVDPFLAWDDPRLAIAHVARVARSTLVAVRR
jgi:predicted ATP-grasp superfamily ATP-dependent carboligase